MSTISADPLTQIPGPNDLGHISKDLWPLAVPIDAVRPDPENAKKHTAENLKVIRTSLTQFGQYQPLVADNTGTLRIGSGRWSQMQELGWKWIAVVRLACSYEEAVAIGLIDNKSSEGGVWNHEVLVKHLHMLQGVNFDLQFTGFQSFEIEPLMQANWTPAEATGNLETDKTAKSGAKSLRIPADLIPTIVAAFDKVRTARKAVEPKMTDLRALECLCLIFTSSTPVSDLTNIPAPAPQPQSLMQFAVAITVDCPACAKAISIAANYVGPVTCLACGAVPYQVMAPAKRKSSPPKAN